MPCNASKFQLYFFLLLLILLCMITIHHCAEDMLTRLGVVQIRTPFYIYTDIATIRPNRPSGPIQWKYILSAVCIEKGKAWIFYATQEWTPPPPPEFHPKGQIWIFSFSPNWAMFFFLNLTMLYQIQKTLYILQRFDLRWTENLLLVLNPVSFLSRISTLIISWPDKSKVISLELVRFCFFTFVWLASPIPYKNAKFDKQKLIWPLSGF